MKETDYDKRLKNIVGQLEGLTFRGVKDILDRAKRHAEIKYKLVKVD